MTSPLCANTGGSRCQVLAARDPVRYYVDSVIHRVFTGRHRSDLPLAAARLPLYPPRIKPSRERPAWAAQCRHHLEDDAGTIPNTVFIPAERKLLFCNGRPSESAYVTCAL